MSVTIKDFYPFNSWVEDKKGPTWNISVSGKREPAFLIDQTTGKSYFNETKGCVRFKCFLLTLGTPFVHFAAAIANVAYRALKLVSFSHFWVPKEKGGSFKDRLSDAGVDVLRIIATPFSYFALELSALYGLLSPYNGRKLYASFERAVYGNFILAPCFQPEPRRHAFGGDINTQNAF